MKRFFKSKRVQDHLIGLLLGGALLTALLSNAHNIGFARDEGFYFSAAESYQKWFDRLAANPDTALTKEVIDKYWRVNHEHPALMKTLFGFSNRIFHKKLGIMAPSTSFRFPGMLTAAITVYLIFIFGALVFDRRAGFAGAAFFALMPRVFYHAHLACFDMPITMMWTAVVYLYYRSLSSWKFAPALGAVFGLALATKLNAFFLPFLLGAHYAALAIYRKLKKQPLPKPWAFAVGLVLSPAVFFAHWPWIWSDTFNRLLGYMGFHSGHPHYNTAYFGENIIQAPTPVSLPLVMTLITVPTIIVLLFVFGAAMRLRHHLPRIAVQKLKLASPPVGPKSKDGFDLLWVAAGLFPLALISLPNVPIFGGTKHWMPAYPLLALIAGSAAARFADKIRELKPAWPKHAISAAALALVLLPPLQQTATSTPFGLASYVPLIGGAPGAADIGMTRQFWGYTTRGVIDYLNKTFPDGARVEIHDTLYSSWKMYKRDGILNKNLVASRLGKSNVALMHHELHMIRNESWIWSRYGTFTPVHVLTYQGVPIVSVFYKNSLQ